MEKKKIVEQSGFLEAPFVRMLRMRSASLKTIRSTYLQTKRYKNKHQNIFNYFPLNSKLKIEHTTKWHLQTRQGPKKYIFDKFCVKIFFCFALDYQREGTSKF